jgi:uronate dehydrogenase
MNRILITGAAGKIGDTLRAGLRGRYPCCACPTCAARSGRRGEEIVRADLTDLAAWKPPCRASIASSISARSRARTLGQDPAEQRRRHLERVRGGARQGVRASSMRARITRSGSTGAPASSTRRSSAPGWHLRVSKVFGEAVGRLFADKHGLSVACLRIGAFRGQAG